MIQLLLLTSDTIEELGSYAETMYDREMIYCIEDRNLYIKIDGTLEKVSRDGGNDITVSSDNLVSLDESISVESVTVAPDNSGVVVNGNKFLGSFSNNKKYLPLLRLSTTDLKTINGSIIIYGDDIKAVYHISACSNGEVFLQGSSSFNGKDNFAKFTINGTQYIGLVCVSNLNANVYLHGFDTRDYDLSGMNFANNNVTNIENL